MCSTQKCTCRILYQPTCAVLARRKCNLIQFSGKEEKEHYAYQLEILFTYFWAQTRKIAKIVADRWGIFLYNNIVLRGNIVFERMWRFISQFPSRKVMQSPKPSNNFLKNELRCILTLSSTHGLKSNYISPGFLYFWIYFIHINSVFIL